MEDIKQHLIKEAESKKFKGKPMIIIKNKFRDEFIEAASKRGWLKPHFMDFVCMCNHQAHNGFIGKEHTHYIIDVGFTTKAAVKKYFFRHLPKASQNRFRTVWPKSMNHHINQMVYLRTDKHGHKNPQDKMMLTRGQARKLQEEVRDLFPKLKVHHLAECKRFKALLEAAKQKNSKADTDTEYESDTGFDI